MNPTFTKNALRHIIKEALEPVLEGPPINDVDFLADEDFMLRWSEGQISERERERFLKYLNRSPDVLLAVSEMVSSGLLGPPPAPRAPEMTTSVAGDISGTPRHGQKIWYYSSAVVLFIALLIAVRFPGFHRKQPGKPAPQVARTTDPPIEQPPSPGHSSWSTRGGGKSPLIDDVTATPEKSVCVVRQDFQGNESILTSEESVPEIVGWFIEKYRLDRTEERNKDAILVIVSDSDGKMEFRHAKGSIMIQAGNLEQAQKSLAQYFGTTTSPSGQLAQPK